MGRDELEIGRAPRREDLAARQGDRALQLGLAHTARKRRNDLRIAKLLLDHAADLYAVALAVVAQAVGGHVRPFEGHAQPAEEAVADLHLAAARHAVGDLLVAGLVGRFPAVHVGADAAQPGARPLVVEGDHARLEGGAAVQHVGKVDAGIKPRVERSELPVGKGVVEVEELFDRREVRRDGQQVGKPGIVRHPWIGIDVLDRLPEIGSEVYDVVGRLGRLRGKVV